MDKTDKKYTWDLCKIFDNEDSFYKCMDRIKELLTKVLELKGHILDNDKTLLTYYDLDNELNTLLEKVYLYAHLDYDNDMSNKERIERKEIVDKLYDEVNSELSFVFPELLKKDKKYVDKLINSNDKLKQYDFDMETTFRYKNHILSEKEEKLLSDAYSIFRVQTEAFNTLNNVDVKFDKIKDENDKIVEVTNSNYNKYLESKNRRVRKSVFNSVYKFYKEHINTISTLYINKVKEDSLISKTRNYDSSLEMSLYNDNVNASLYKNLIKVTNSNIESLQKYYKVKAKSLGIPKLHMYDLYLNIADMPESKIPFDDGVKLVLEALKPLGETYIKDITHLINNRCIDVYPKKNKKSGAYQWGPYSTEPFVSLNYEGTIDSVSTLAHEMGHAMHSYYSDANNIYCYAGYPIFLAEIASTVNEMLFSEYMSKNSKSDEEKIYFLVEFLDKFKATIYRQTMFAEYEYLIHDKHEKGEALTKDLLCETYLDLNKKEFSPSVVVDSDIEYEWSRIPHFYSSFYVYKYATGLISAIVIVNKLLNNEEGFKEKYIKFLSSGGSDYPLNILNELGIDITNEEVLNSAFKTFDNKVNELNDLINKKGK